MDFRYVRKWPSLSLQGPENGMQFLDIWGIPNPQIQFRQGFGGFSMVYYGLLRYGEGIND